MAKPTRKYRVTFVELKKYNPATRTVTVDSCDSVHASLLVYQMFGRKKIKVKSAVKARNEDEEIQEKAGSN